MEKQAKQADNSEDAGKLAQLLGAYAPHDGRFDLPVPGIQAVRVTEVTGESIRGVSQLSLCIVAQGAKQVRLGTQTFEYDRSRIAIYSAEVPVAANIIRASKTEPYLCLVVHLDTQRLAELAVKVFPHGVPKGQDLGAVYVGQQNPDILKAGVRLMELAGQPGDAELLAPLVIDEILIRLLRCPVGAAIAQLGMTDSSVHKIARAITWIRENYAEPLRIEALAKLAGMSLTSFHQHFKSVTSMSPLQYQKVLRLQEARHLMLTRMMDVSSASLQVGYSSLSQFSREYSRFFGNAPTRDVAKLRDQPAAVNG